MKALGRIALANMLLVGMGQGLPYGMGKRSKPKKRKKSKKKAVSKVVYYTDENGDIKRKKVLLEENE